MRDVLRFTLHQPMWHTPWMPFTGIRIAEEAQDRLPERGRHVHRSAIAADRLFAGSKSSEKIG